MNKQKIQLLVAGIFLALVAAAYIGMRYYNSKTPEETTMETYTVTQDELASVTQFSFTNESGSFSFIKTEEGWQYDGDLEMAIDTTVLEGMIERVVAVTSENQLEAVQDMAQYGLEKPQITISYATTEDSKTLKIGDFNATLSLYYLGLEGSDTVYTTDGSFRLAFTKTLDDLKRVEAEE